MATGLADSVKSKGEKPLKMYTHPSGQPAELRPIVGDRYVKERGYKEGYDPKAPKGVSLHPDGDPNSKHTKAKAPAK
jgi:hypothetical protein